MKEFIEKLIGRLEEQRGHICNCMPCNGCKYIGDCNEGEFAEDVALDKAIEIVNQLAEEYRQDLDKNSQGWISCSERLPEIGERVLLWVYGRVSIGKRIDAKLFEEYDIFSLENGANESTKRIEAWQPLPTPYQPKGE